MHLRKRILPPARFEDDEHTDRRALDPTKPAHPHLLKQSTVPFDPDLPVVAWNTNPLDQLHAQALDSSANETEIAHDVEHNVQKIEDVDRMLCSSQIRWPESNYPAVHLQVEVAQGGNEQESEYQRSIMAEMETSSESGPEEIDIQARRNICWSELSMSMQIQIYTNLRRSKTSEKVADRLGLCANELKDIESHRSFRFINPVDEEKLRNELLARLMDFQLSEAQSLRGLTKGSNHWKETNDRYMNFLVLHRNYAYASQSQIDLAVEFLRQQKVDIRVAGVWAEEFEDGQTSHQPRVDPYLYPTYSDLLKQTRSSHASVPAEDKGDETRPTLANLGEENTALLDAEAKCKKNTRDLVSTKEQFSEAYRAVTKKTGTPLEVGNTDQLVAEHHQFPLQRLLLPAAQSSPKLQALELSAPLLSTKSPGIPDINSSRVDIAATESTAYANQGSSQQKARALVTWPRSILSPPRLLGIPLNRLAQRPTRVSLKITKTGEAVVQNAKRKRLMSLVTEIRPKDEIPDELEYRRVEVTERGIALAKYVPDAFATKMIQIGIDAGNRGMSTASLTRPHGTRSSISKVSPPRISTFEHEVLGSQPDYLAPKYISTDPERAIRRGDCLRQKLDAPLSPVAPPWSPITDDSRNKSNTDFGHGSLANIEDASMRDVDLQGEGGVFEEPTGHASVVRGPESMSKQPRVLAAVYPLNLGMTLAQGEVRGPRLSSNGRSQSELRAMAARLAETQEIMRKVAEIPPSRSKIPMDETIEILIPMDADILHQQTFQKSLTPGSLHARSVPRSSPDPLGNDVDSGIGSSRATSTEPEIANQKGPAKASSSLLSPRRRRRDRSKVEHGLRHLRISQRNATAQGTVGSVSNTKRDLPASRKPVIRAQETSESVALAQHTPLTYSVGEPM